MKKLAIISTHPIQYNAPWFVLLASDPAIQLRVFYTWSQRQTDLYDDTFGKVIEWDIPLLEGYDFTFVTNVAKKPCNTSFWGIQCPTLIQEIEAWGATHILVSGWKFDAHFKAMRYFKGKIPVLFRGDSNLVDYDVKDFKSFVGSVSRQRPGLSSGFRIFRSSLRQYLKFQLRKIFLTYIYSYIDTALYVGQNNKAYYKAHGLKDSQLTFVPHAIDNARFNDGVDKQYEQKACKWRHDLGIDVDDIVILFAGKFEPKKDPIILLDAYIELLSKFSGNQKSNIFLLYLGSGPLEKELQKKSLNYPNILFMPFQNQSQMPLVYRLANIFCLPSQGPGETWGLAVNEAMACGRPVLVSDRVGCAVDLGKLPNRVFNAGNKQDLIHNLGQMLQEVQEKAIERSTLEQQIEAWCFSVIVKAIRNEITD